MPIQDTVESRMQTDISRVRGSDSLATAISIMLRDNRDILHVVNEAGGWVGLVPDFSLVKAAQNHESLSQPISSLVCRNMLVCTACTPLFEVAPLFRESRFARIPIIKQRVLVGELRRIDVLAWLMTATENQTSALSTNPERQSAPVNAPKFLKHHSANLAQSADCVED